MATLMSAAITLLGADLDDGWTGTTTAHGNVNKLTLVDDTLYEKVADWVSDGMVVYLPDGPSGGSPETRVVDSLGGHDLTVKSAFSVKVNSGSDYEIHKLFTRSQKLVALRQAAPLLCPGIHAVVRDMSLETVSYQYEFNLSALSIYQNRPHQVLLAQGIIENIWEAGVTYEEDDVVRPTTLAKFTGYTYICTIAGEVHASTEPTWPTEIDDTVEDNEVTWTCLEDTDYSNYPMLPLHDWDITPDGKLFLNADYAPGYKLMVVGIKPLAFTGSNATETIALDSPFDLVLSAQAAQYLWKQRASSAGTQDVEHATTQVQSWTAELALRSIKYWMKPPDGTIITGAGLTV